MHIWKRIFFAKIVLWKLIISLCQWLPTVLLHFFHTLRNTAIEIFKKLCGTNLAYGDLGLGKVQKFQILTSLMGSESWRHEVSMIQYQWKYPWESFGVLLKSSSKLIFFANLQFSLKICKTLRCHKSRTAGPIWKTFYRVISGENTS